MHSLSESSESLLPVLDTMPEVVPAMGRVFMFEPELDLRVDGVRVVDVDVDHEEPDELDELRDDELDERVELREVL